MHGDGFGCLHTEDISGHISSCSRSFFRPFISRFFLLAFFLSSFYLAFLPARVFFLSSFYLAFRPARVLSFVLLSRVSFFRPFISRFVLLAFFFFLLSRVSSCPRSLFLPARVLSFVLLSRVLSFFLLAFFFFLLAFFFFLLAFSFSSCSRSFFRPFISRFVLLEFIFLNKSPSKICIYQKFVVPLHSNLNILVRD